MAFLAATCADHKSKIEARNTYLVSLGVQGMMVVAKDSKVDVKAMPSKAATMVEDNGALGTESELQSRTGWKASCTNPVKAAVVEEQWVGKARFRVLVLEALARASERKAVM